MREAPREAEEDGRAHDDADEERDLKLMVHRFASTGARLISSRESISSGVGTSESIGSLARAVSEARSFGEKGIRCCTDRRSGKTSAGITPTTVRKTPRSKKRGLPR